MKIIGEIKIGRHSETIDFVATNRTRASSNKKCGNFQSYRIIIEKKP